MLLLGKTEQKHPGDLSPIVSDLPPPQPPLGWVEIANVNFLQRYGTYVLQNTKKENLLRLSN